MSWIIFSSSAPSYKVLLFNYVELYSVFVVKLNVLLFIYYDILTLFVLDIQTVKFLWIFFGKLLYEYFQ